jgi:DNA-binding LacI/PurR family transcriptional regulator
VTTLVDVARRAGVSKSTVSNVIRGATLVADTTRERVERAIADVGYHPNAIARSLKARASKAVGIVSPIAPSPFYAELWLSGAVPRLGQQCGVPAPTHRFIAQALALQQPGRQPL